MVRIVLVSSLLVACAKEREPAPTEMVDLVRYLFDRFEEDDATIEGMTNLNAWIADNVRSDEADEGFRLDPLTKQDVASVDHPKRSFDALLGAAGGAVSGYRVAEHVDHILVADQTFANPNQYETYKRKFDAGKGGFADGETILRTRNEVLTKSWGIKIPYTLHKDYRWVETDDGRQHILGRSWIEDRSCNDAGGSCLELSFSVDVFQDVKGGCNRWTATWSEATSSIDIPENLMIAGLAGGLQNVFDHTEEFLDNGLKLD